MRRQIDDGREFALAWVVCARTARAAAQHGFALGFGLEAGAPPGAPPALVIPRVVARDEVEQIEALARRAEEDR